MNGVERDSLQPEAVQLLSHRQVRSGQGWVSDSVSRHISVANDDLTQATALSTDTLNMA